MPDTTEAQRLLRLNIRLLAAASVVIVIGLLILGVIANSSRLTGEDNRNATETAFANQARSACITQRRSIQFDHLGGMQVHTLRALAALADDDDETFLREVAAGLDEAAGWEAAVETLSADVLDEPPPVGCGPPVTNLEQLDE